MIIRKSSMSQNRILAILLVASLLFVLSVPFGVQEAKAATFNSYFGPDLRPYRLYVPSSYQAGTPMPMMVILHGCSQQPEDVAIGTRMNSIAEREGFLVVYPEQPMIYNAGKCWNWYYTWNQQRGMGEPKSIVGIVNQVKSRYSVNSSRVYVAGGSAGACMSVILGATYPDVFTAIGVLAGVEYNAAESATESLVLAVGGGPDPVQQGNKAYDEMGSQARVVPTIVFHGTCDPVVNIENAHQVISQWAQTNDRASDGVDNNNIDDIAEETITGFEGKSYTRSVYKNSVNNQIVMEKYIIDGGTHAWPGGDCLGTFVDPDAPNASEIMWAFFMNYTK